MTPTFKALLCLGEMRTRGKPWSGWDPALQPGPGQSGDSRLQEVHREEEFRLKTQDSGSVSHGDSLPGLGAGPRIHIQAGESVPRVPWFHVLIGDKGPPLDTWRWKTAGHGLTSGGCLGFWG